MMGYSSAKAGENVDSEMEALACSVTALGCPLPEATVSNWSCHDIGVKSFCSCDGINLGLSGKTQI